MIAQSEIELSPEDLEVFAGLVDALEDDDDVQKYIITLQISNDRLKESVNMADFLTHKVVMDKNVWRVWQF